MQPIYHLPFIVSFQVQIAGLGTCGFETPSPPDYAAMLSRSITHSLNLNGGAAGRLSLSRHTHTDSLCKRLQKNFYDEQTE